jgi:hypothetical protein
MHATEQGSSTGAIKCIWSPTFRAVTVMTVMGVMSAAQADGGACCATLVAGFPVACCADVLVDSCCCSRANMAPGVED